MSAATTAAVGRWAELVMLLLLLSFYSSHYYLVFVLIMIHGQFFLESPEFDPPSTSRAMCVVVIQMRGNSNSDCSTDNKHCLRLFFLQRQ
jgi:hypothetical protein